jgi:hypothetical protein
LTAASGAALVKLPVVADDSTIEEFPMNTDKVSELYDRLTPAERLQLIEAARTRGDELDQKRLIRSARVMHAYMFDYQPLEKAQRTLVLWNLIMLLGAALAFGLGFLYADALSCTCGGAARARRKQAKCLGLCDGCWTRALVRYRAQELVTLFDAWTQFCSERLMDPFFIIQKIPGWDTIASLEPIARKVALTPEEAALFARIAFPSDETSKEGEQDGEGVAQLVKELHSLLDSLIELEKVGVQRYKAAAPHT